jgi:DeoR/GlpR family transcriptional regulator of sugar metabolism
VHILLKGQHLLNLSLTNRQIQILHVLRNHQPLSIRELAQFTQLSDSSLRRDTRELVEIGLVISEFGKLRLNYATNSENPFLLRKITCEEEKTRIASAAMDLVENGDTIFIAGGTTTLACARVLPNQHRITVITNALPVAMTLTGRRNIKLVVLGGEVRQEEMNMHGHLTLFGIEQLRADKLFYGIEAISLEHGLMHNQLLEVNTDRALIDASTQTIVVADHTKFGKVASAVVVPLSQIQTIVTGKELQLDIREQLEKMDLQVILV